MFCSVGFVNAFGVFEEYYQYQLLSNQSASQISWLGSFNIFCMFGFTLLVGWLNDKHGPRILLIIGSIIMLFALFMTSLCHSYWQLFLAQGFLFGIGLSFVVLPAFAVSNLLEQFIPAPGQFTSFTPDFALEIISLSRMLSWNS